VRRCTTLVVVLLIGFVLGSSRGFAAPCTAQEKAARQNALAAYVKRMPKERKAYFRTHRKAPQRQAFVKRQQAKLKALRNAATCTVQPSPSPNVPPTAVLTIAPTSPTTGESVTFDASKSSDTDGTIAFYAWTFGDGATAAGKTVSHAYSQAGSYPITLTVTDDRGASRSATQAIRVFPRGDATYTFGAGVTDAQADEIRRDVPGAVAYYEKIGVTAPGFELRGYPDAESTAQAYSAYFGTPINAARQIWESSTAVASVGIIFLNVGARGWTESTGPQRAKILTHEIFHIVQGHLAGASWSFGPSNTVPTAGPRWLIEGAAELAGFAGAADMGLLSLDQARAQQIANSKYADAVPLSTWATLDGVNAHPRAAYNLFFTAVDFLTRDKGTQSLVAYWRAIGAGKTWQDAFVTTFGRSIDSFYFEFEEYRRGL
jgi:hypothetical protein